MAITERLGRLRWIALHKYPIRMGQAHHVEMDLTFHATNHAQGLAKINLRPLGSMLCMRLSGDT